MTVNYGEFIRETRMNKGVSIKELANKIGVSESMLFSVERGKRNLSVTLAADIADALGVKVIDLLGLKESDAI